MKDFFRALGLSLLIHAALAAVLAFYLTYGPAPDAPPLLDMSSVEISFAETVEESAAAAFAAPPPAPAPKTPPPAALSEPPPESASSPAAPPPEPDTTPQLETPEERHEPMKPAATTEQTAPSAAAAPRQARIDAPPKPRRSIRPDYPRGARQRGEQGEVLVEITVGEDGSVTAADVARSCGYAELDAAALDAVRKARFTPAKSGNRPVETTVRLTLKFRLH